MTAAETLKARQREAWGAAPWEPMATRFAPIHDDLVDRLGPRPGERWLDVGTGTGAVARRAALRGAQATGVDLAPGMIAAARRLAAGGRRIVFEVGDAERLPYPDGAFDVVASALGVFLAPDHAAAARELARVCRPGGRLGVVAWRRDRALEQLHAPFWPPADPAAGDRRAWGREAYVAGLLGDDFELTFHAREIRIEAASGEELWRVWSAHDGPARQHLATLAPDRVTAYHRAYVAHHERFREGDRVIVPRRYLLTLGRRRPRPAGLRPLARPRARTPTPRRTAMPLQLGDTAPDFEAETTEGPIRFHDWIGDSWAVLFSHPRDFTPVCTTELGYMAKIKPEFDKRDVKIIGLSVDPLTNHERWAADIEDTQGAAPNYPLIGDADFSVSKLYGMLPADVEGDPTQRTPAQNQTVRNVFVIGPDKKVKLILVYPMTTGRNFDEVLRVVDSLQLTARHRVATPVNWHQGEDVIIAGSVSDDEAREIFGDWEAPRPYIRVVPQPA